MSKQAKKGLVPERRFPEFRDAGVWEKKQIGQISETVTAGGTPSTSVKEYWGGGIRWMNSGELNYKKVHEVQGRITENGLRNSSTKIIPKMCVLIGLAGQGKTRGTVAMNMVELCINQSIAAIFPNEESFSSDFLYHNLDNRYDELRNLSAGGEGRGGLNLQIIKSLGIPLPSLNEQQKIADCLTSVDELITAQTQKLAALKTHKKGLMQQLFPAEGETVPQRRFPEFRDKGEWVESTFGDVATFINGRAYKQEELLDQGEYRVLRVGNFFTNKEWYYSDLELEDDKYCDDGDLLYAWSASFGPKIWRGEKVIYHYHIWKVLEKDGVDKRFLFVLLSYETERMKAQSANGLGLLHITKGTIESWKCKFPKIKEQQKIADCLTSIDDLITAQSQKLDALKAHKKSLMQQLFPTMDEVSA